MTTNLINVGIYYLKKWWVFTLILHKKKNK